MSVTVYPRPANDLAEELKRAKEDFGLGKPLGAPSEAIISRTRGTEEEKTSEALENPYASVYDDALKKLVDRKPFFYSAEGDAMYQHYKDRYTDSAERAMKDIMGQAAAMTGGYASSYAQSAGQQAYDETMEGLDDVIPELYQLAKDQYDRESSDLQDKYLYASDAYDRWEAEHAENAPVVDESDESDESPRSLAETRELYELFTSLYEKGDYRAMLMQLETLPLTYEEAEYYYNMIPYEWLQAYTEGGDLQLIEGNAEAWIQNLDNVARWNEIVGKVLSDFSLESLTEEERRIYDMLAPLTEGLPS